MYPRISAALRQFSRDMCVKPYEPAACAARIQSYWDTKFVPNTAHLICTRNQYNERDGIGRIGLRMREFTLDIKFL